MVIGTSFAIMKAKAEVAKSNFSAVQISTCRYPSSDDKERKCNPPGGAILRGSFGQTNEHTRGKRSAWIAKVNAPVLGEGI